MFTLHAQDGTALQSQNECPEDFGFPVLVDGEGECYWAEALDPRWHEATAEVFRMEDWPECAGWTGATFAP